MCSACSGDYENPEMTALDPEFTCPQCKAMVAAPDGKGTCHRCGTVFEMEDFTGGVKKELGGRTGLYLRERTGKPTEVPGRVSPASREWLERARVTRHVVEAPSALADTRRAKRNREQGPWTESSW
jgi:hypothetical protein